VILEEHPRHVWKVTFAVEVVLSSGRSFHHQETFQLAHVLTRAGAILFVTLVFVIVVALIIAFMIISSTIVVKDYIRKTRCQ
jgi:hypothetical protein